MSDLRTLLEGNRRTAADFDQGGLPILPRLATILVTCVDARVDPAHIFDLDLGDAIVIRNAGGRITPEVQRELGVLGVLASQMPGTGEVQPELVIIHHTDCGMSRLTNPAIQVALSEKLGLPQSDIEAMAITDPAATVHDDIERLRQSPNAPDELIVSGLVYDVATGMVQQVTGPARLRSTDAAGSSDTAGTGSSGAKGEEPS